MTYELRVRMNATAVDKATPVNLAQHTYWNLGGEGSGDVLHNTVQLFASARSPAGRPASTATTPITTPWTGTPATTGRCGRWPSSGTGAGAVGEPAWGAVLHGQLPPGRRGEGRQGVRAVRRAVPRDAGRREPPKFPLPDRQAGAGVQARHGVQLLLLVSCAVYV